MRLACLIVPIFIASAAQAAGTPPVEKVERNGFHRWVAEHSDSVQISDEPRTQLCSSVVDCRRKGHTLASIQLNGRDISAVSQYPSPERIWDSKKGGYVLKTYGNVE